MILLIVTDADRLYAGCDALRIVYIELVSNGQVITDVKGQLSAIAGMEDICRSLQRLIGAIDNQVGQCRRLSQSLDIICQTYTSCENRILDRCEDVVIRYEQPPTEFVDLSSATELLREISFHMDGGDTAWPQDLLK